MISTYLNNVFYFACLNFSVVSNSLQLHVLPHQAPLFMEFFRQEYWNGDFPCGAVNKTLLPMHGAWVSPWSGNQTPHGETKFRGSQINTCFFVLFFFFCLFFLKNTVMGSHSLLQGIFPTQGLNPGLLHCRQILYSEPSGKPHIFCIFPCIF